MKSSSKATVSDGSIGKNEIVANRRIVITTLENSILFDVEVSRMDMNYTLNIMAIIAGRIVYILDMTSLAIVVKLGRAQGSIHKDNVTDCAFHPSGKFIATCSMDPKIAIWSIESGRAEIILDKHAGGVNRVKFSSDGEILYSCSDDGKLFSWNWSKKTILESYIRHPAAINSFTVNSDFPFQILCARVDGCVSCWNTEAQSCFDNINSDPDWTDQKNEKNIADKRKNHTGSITCLELSHNSHYLATGSGDSTCKLWDVTSYFKDYGIVQQENQDSKNTEDRLCGYIDVLEESYDIQLAKSDFSSLKAGEVSIQSGFHADLIFTYKHESAVLDVKFNNDSKIVITGSSDFTCRLWSTRRGDLLFQINAPAAVNCIYIDKENRIFASCLDRLLIFGINALPKEKDLPVQWQSAEEPVIEGEDLVDEEEEVKFRIINTAHSEKPRSVNAPDNSDSNKNEHYLNQSGHSSEGNRGMVQNSDSHQNHKSSSVNVPVAKSLSLNTLKDPNQDTNHELSKLIQNHSTPNIPTEDLISEEENLANELRAHRRSSSVKIIRMIRNGVFVPRFLETLIEEYPEYENVIENIKTYNIDVKVILAAISSGKFDTKDVLKVLSTNVKSQADFAFGALQMASKDAFTDFMENKGFKIHSNHSRQSSHDSAGQVTSVDSVERKKSKDKFLLEDRSLSQSSNKGNSLSQVLNSSNTKTQLLNSSNTKSQLLNASNAAQLLNISGNNRSADIIGSDSPKILKKALEPPKATRFDTSVQHVINEGPLEVGSNNPPQKRLDSRSRIIPEPEHSEYDPITHLMISKKSQTPPVESIRNSTIRNSAIRSSISKPKSNPDESESDFVKTSIKKYDSEGNLRGSIVHFVPSAQLKILKDVSKSDAVKPIFLRQLLQSNNSSYPNFRVEDVNVEKEIPFTRKKEARFNEKIDGLLLDKGNSSQVQKNRLDKSVFKRPPRPTSPITPENYLKTRGMNVSFDKKIVKKQGSNLYMGRVFAQNKIEVGSGSRMNLRQSFLVGKKMAVQDYGVDLDDDD